MLIYVYRLRRRDEGIVKLVFHSSMISLLHAHFNTLLRYSCGGFRIQGVFGLWGLGFCVFGYGKAFDF